MGRDGDIRVGTTDRERAIAALGDHFSAGRLDVDEYQQRCGAASAARTQKELSALFKDLPAAGAVEPVPRPREPRNPLIESSGPRARTLVIVFAVVCVTATVAVVAITGSWWVLLPALIVLALFFMAS